MPGYKDEAEEEGYSLVRDLVNAGVSPSDLRRWRHDARLFNLLANTLKGDSGGLKKIVSHRDDPMFPGVTVENP